jgi:hypothetical protein
MYVCMYVCIYVRMYVINLKVVVIRSQCSDRPPSGTDESWSKFRPKGIQRLIYVRFSTLQNYKLRETKVKWRVVAQNVKFDFVFGPLDKSGLYLRLYRLFSSAHHRPCHSLSRSSLLNKSQRSLLFNVLDAFINETRNQAWVIKERKQQSMKQSL